MKNRGEHKVLQRKDGKYFIDLDITVEEWREMLLNDEVLMKYFMPKPAIW